MLQPTGFYGILNASGILIIAVRTAYHEPIASQSMLLTQHTFMVHGHSDRYKNSNTILSK